MTRAWRRASCCCSKRPEHAQREQTARARGAAGREHRLRFHDLRHTCASLLIAAGAHPKAIHVRLGHSDIRITMNRYGHLFPAEDMALAEALDATYAAGIESPANVVRLG